MTACWLLHSRSAHFLRNVDTCGNFYFLKSISINTQYSCLWDTLEMMLFTKNQIKMKMHWPNWLKFLVGLFIVLFRTRYEEIDAILVQHPFKGNINRKGELYGYRPFTDICNRAGWSMQKGGPHNFLQIAYIEGNPNSWINIPYPFFTSKI